ncbi:MAG: heme exporter protein CcmD [Caulobacter sp.]|nr:heme exporter protein CcmD [Caulobacter sp.]
MMPDLDTGKYALFVWPAFAVTALGFAWMIADSLARARRWKAQVERLSGKTGR